jgi:two-component system chemotaxis sensor kinase CheA
VIAVRGDLISYISMRDAFDIPGVRPDIEKIVIAQHEDERVGVVVDRVIGSHQTVIQSLGTFYRNVQVCSGATIMGDGRVALILDVAGLVRWSAEQGEHTGNPVPQAISPPSTPEFLQR